ncbi:phage tail tape measure protein [Anaerotruncus rubiinfantis]|uniref:phage tail tape measure protein n=1 Tax=Anaerotruncus rubiinfantis TaxID=1720200 RepID=UPI001FABB778|nr:phage tail tape measure protein [Anaerotruncus rubiinfantis]
MAQADGSIIIDSKLDSSGLESGLKKLGSVGSAALKGTAVAIGAVGAALGAAGAAAIKVGSDFEAGMSKVAAISGAAGDELEALSDKAKEMGAKTKFSATEAASAFEYMAMAGWKTTDMLGGIEGIMNLAAASGEDLAAVSDIVTDALTAFGLSAQDSGHFADVLAQASSNANTNVGLMGATFKYVAPVAGAMGYSIEDTAVAIGLMANAGIKGEQAGTALRAMFTRLVKPPKDAADALDALGISAANSDGSMRPLSDLLGELREKLSGLTDEEKASYAAGIAGQEAMSGLLAIVGASEADFEKLTAAVNGADGAALRMAETMQDNLQGQITILKSGLEGLGIAFYESVQDPLRDVAKSATKYVDQIAKAFKRGGIAATVESLGGIFAEVAIKAAQSAPQFIDTVVQAIQAFVTGIRDNLPQLAEAAIGIITSLVTGILELLPSILETGVELIAQLALGIAQALPELIPAAVDAILTLAESLIDNIDLLIDAALQLMIGLSNGLIEALPQLLEKAPEIIQKLCDALINNFPLVVTTAYQVILTLATALINNIPQIIQASMKIMASLASGLLQFIGNVIQSALQIGQKIRDTFLSINWLQLGKDIIMGIADGVKNYAIKLANAVKDAAKAAIDGAKDFLGIHSPSTRFRDEIGKPMMQGIGVGFEDQAAQVFSKMQATLDFETSHAAEKIAVPAAFAASSGAPQKVTNENGVTVYVEYQGTGDTTADAKKIGREIGREAQKDMRRRGLVPT